MPPKQNIESVSINIRAKAKRRDLIDQAANRLGRSRSDFMLQAACREAEDVLLDQAFFQLIRGHSLNFKRFLTSHCHQLINCADYSRQKHLGKNESHGSPAAVTHNNPN